MSEEHALAVIPEQNSAQLTRRATDAAGACKAIVLKTVKRIGTKDYVQVEGWQSIANALGCVASARDVELVEGGIRAMGEVRRVDTGAIISTAEGFVGDDEPTWASRPQYARRAMAQTRAISRACRSAFAFVVTMMNANLQTSPAEEMEGLAIEEEKTVKPTQRKSSAPAEKVQGGTSPPKGHDAGAGEETIEFVPLDCQKFKNKANGGTRYEVVLPDGRKCSTFDDMTGDFLKEAAASELKITALIETKTKDGKTYTNFLQVKQAS